MEHESIKCCGCHELLFEPYVITCGHTLCSQCIHRPCTKCPACQASIRNYLKSIDMQNLVQALYPQEYEKYCRDEKPNTFDVNDEKAITEMEYVVNESFPVNSNYNTSEILLQLLEPIAQKGFPSAEYAMGLFYDSCPCFAGGDPPHTDMEYRALAKMWFQRAFAHAQEYASQGLAFGQYTLGMCYLYGKGVARNEKKAMEWLHKAAEQKYHRAMRWVNVISMDSELNQRANECVC